MGQSQMKKYKKMSDDYSDRYRKFYIDDNIELLCELKRTNYREYCLRIYGVYPLKGTMYDRLL